MPEYYVKCVVLGDGGTTPEAIQWAYNHALQEVTQERRNLIISIIKSSSRSIAITPVRRKNNECASHVELHPIWVNKPERNDSYEKQKNKFGLSDKKNKL